MRYRRLMPLALITAVMGTAVVSTNVPAFASGPVAPTPKAPLTAAEVRGSVSYLMNAYGVSEAEALRRMELQRTSADLEAVLEKRYPTEYAGLWLDQKAGGKLIVAATDVPRLRTALSEVRDRTHIVVTKADRSLRQLNTVRDRLNHKINNSPNPKVRAAEVTVDVPTNVVAVYQHAANDEVGGSIPAASLAQAEKRLSAAPDGRIAAAIAAESTGVVIRQLIAGAPKSGTGAAVQDSPVGGGCDPVTCGPPMRGGMRLNILRSAAAPTDASTHYNNAWWGECTNGFNVRDSRRNWQYILTAGHCTVGDYKAGVNYSYSSAETGSNNVGYEVFDFENGSVNGGSTYPQDYAIQPYRDGGAANYWLGGGARQNLVNSSCRKDSSTWQGCQDGAFAIRGVYSYEQIGAGWVACGTGSGDSSSSSGYSTNVGYRPGTRCGEVTSKNGGIVTNICTRPGDSGGPLFSEIDGMAYGILHGGTDGQGECPTNPPGGEVSDYSPISVIMKHVNDQTVYSEGINYDFHVATS